MDDANPEFEKETSPSPIVLETMFVLAPAVGALPFTLPKAGVFGAVARNNTYPFADAPEDGKVAAFQDRSMLLDDVAVAVKLVACAVAGLDSVLNVFSSP